MAFSNIVGCSIHRLLILVKKVSIGLYVGLGCLRGRKFVTMITVVTLITTRIFTIKLSEKVWNQWEF
jgi:hypothetical protein